MRSNLELRTPLCRDLGIEYPIFSVGFGASAGPELVSAVSNAGGCGVLGGSSGSMPTEERGVRFTVEDAWSERDVGTISGN